MDKIDAELLLFDRPPGDLLHSEGVLPPLANSPFVTHFYNVYNIMGGAACFNEFDYYGTTYAALF